jgi:hypothetical protein
MSRRNCKTLEMASGNKEIGGIEPFEVFKDLYFIRVRWQRLYLK